MAESAELVFFDTFSHESSEEINLDLVQFPNIVYISEVRIIPLGARVQADFPGGVRLGATNPSQFEIEFFVNDLEKPGACTFESLGGFEYKQNGSIHLECKRKVPTDGLVLRGWYTTITLAVYGIPREAMQEQSASSNAHSHSHLTLPLTSDALPPPEAVAASAATQEWVQQHAQVADPYNGGYQSDQNQAIPLGPPSGDYSLQSSHNYHEEWNQQSSHGPPSSRAGLLQGGGNISSEGYDVSKDPLPWENANSRSEDKLPWERDRKDRERDRDRDRDRERDRDRDRERDRDRDRDRDREHDRDRDRDRLRERGRERDRDRDVYSRERSRDRSRDRSPDRDWDDRRRDDRDRNREKARDRSNSGSRDYNRAVSRDRDRDRDSDWDGKRRSGEWTSRRDRDHDREHNRSSNSWGDRSPDDHHRLGPHVGHRDRKQRDGSWERDRERDRDRDRDRDRGSHHGAEWDERDRDDVPSSRKRPRTPPNPPHVPHKRPHTPPEEKPELSPPAVPPPQIKKEGMSPPATQVQFGSISPGDVESISEGEIPEADPDAEMEPSDVKLDIETPQLSPKLAAESEPGRESESAEIAVLNAVQDAALDPATQTDKAKKDETANNLMRPLSVDLMIDDSRDREAAANLALLAAGGDPSLFAAATARPPLLATPSPLASPAVSVSSNTSATRVPANLSSLPSPARASVPPVQVPSPNTITPSPHPLLTVATASPTVDFPVNHDEASLDGEQFEPILSDEEIEDDSQFQDMEFFAEESEELCKTFNPFNFELQPLVYLKNPSISICEAQFLRRYQKESERKEEADKKKNIKNSNDSSVQHETSAEAIPFETRRLEEIVLQFEAVNGKKGIKESWVDAAEQACSFIPAGLPLTQKRKEILSRLVTWVRVGVNFNLALQQPQPGYKIRHIKVGVRLVEVLCMCSGSLAEQLITNVGIHHRLLRLYHQDCMSLSIKLMILRALDASLRTKRAVEHFLQLRTSLPRMNGLKFVDRLKANDEVLQVNKMKAFLQTTDPIGSVQKPGDKEIKPNEMDSRTSSEGLKEDISFETVSGRQLEDAPEEGNDSKASNDADNEITNVELQKIASKAKLSETSLEGCGRTMEETGKRKAGSDETLENSVFDIANTVLNKKEEDEELSSEKQIYMKENAQVKSENNHDHKCQVDESKGSCQQKKVFVNVDGKKIVKLLKKKVSDGQAFDGLNGYQALLLMFKAEKLSRTKFAISNLLRKLHIYEVLDKFKNSIKSVVEANNSSIISDTPEKRITVIESSFKSTMEIPNLCASSDTEQIDTLVACLTEVISVYQQAPLLLAQPKRFLPSYAQFDLGACSLESHRPYHALFAFLECHQFLECCNVLLTSPYTVNCSVILGPLCELIKTLADSQEGLQYLATHVDATNVLLRILLQQPSSEDLLDESAISPSSTQFLGLSIAYRLQALHFIDQILEALSSGSADPERQEIFDCLLGLFHLTFTNIGKISVIHVLCSGDFMKVLLDLTSYNPPETDAKYRKYPGKNFIDDLIVFAVKFGANGCFLQQFGLQILKVATSSKSKLHDIVPYLKVLENSQLFSYDDITPLCEIIKRNIEQTASFPGELITALRILKYLAVPSQESGNVLDYNANHQYSYLELKYKYVVLELFSLDGVSHLTGVLSKMCEAYEQPAVHATAFLGVRGASIMSIILPALELLRQMLTLVIQSRNTDFRDLTAINVLLQTFTLLHAFPNSAFASEAAQKGCREVIETLLAYTQPVQPESLSESEGLNKSLWTLMMSEVLKYITTNAHTFMSGLYMLSELLPLPLPVQTRTALPDTEAACTMNSRKLWCAHLHSLSPTISDLISTLCSSSSPALLQLLRRVCVQLSDLAAPTALVVARSALDGILVSLSAQPKVPPNISGNSTPATDGPCSSHTARLLNFLACLISHASVKCAVLNLLCAGARGSGVKADERFPQLVSHMCHLLTTPFDLPSHIQAQECVVSVIQSLCDVEISLMPPPRSGSSTSPQQFLACALPPREILSVFCSSLLDHMANPQHSFTTLLPSVRTFLMLVEHDYGFYHLKSCLLKKTEALWHLFAKFCSSFSKDSADLLSTLSTTLELLRVCITPEGEYAETEIMSVNKSAKPTDSPGPTGSSKQAEDIKEEPEPMETDMEGSKEKPETSDVDLVPVKIEPTEEMSEDSSSQKKLDYLPEQIPEKLPVNDFQNSPLHISNLHHPHHHLTISSKAHNVDLDTSTSSGLPSRRLSLSVSELATAIGWNRTDLPQPFDNVENGEALQKRHPIVHLEKLLRESCLEDETLESLHESVFALIRLLESETGPPTEPKACPENLEILIPPPESLLTQFAYRPVFTICEPEDDRLTQGYWLAVPPADEADQDVEQVTCDLLDLSREYTPDLHLLSESVRLCRLRAGLGDDIDVDRTDIESTKKRPGGEDIKYLSADLKTRRPFVTPMRGRGFTRPVPQRGDLFRSRPPNTSRPPSLHVDDFVALETCGAQPTGPTGYNKLSIRAAKDMMATRSRGRGRGFGSDRGRFFGSNHQYRRDGGLRVSNLRGEVQGNWGSHEGQGQMSNIGPQRSFRNLDQNRDVRIMRSDEKLGPGLAGRLGGIRTSGINWPSGKERDRFGGGPMGRGGGNNRRDSGRHQRTFTR